MGVLTYPPSERKEALDAAHGHMRTASVTRLDSGCEGIQWVWLLYRPLGY
jgi:hypothetical protein